MSNRLEIRELGLTTLLSPIRFKHEGVNGGSETKGFYIKSNSSNHAYTNITLSIEEIAAEVIAAADFFTENGWSIKLLKKSSDDFPSEREWGEVFPMTSISLDNVGDVENHIPDIVTKQYVFIRVFCPGHSTPGQYEHKIKLTYNSILLTPPIT
jgi:hypothetical protein